MRSVPLRGSVWVPQLRSLHRLPTRYRVVVLTSYSHDQDSRWLLPRGGTDLTFTRLHSKGQTGMSVLLKVLDECSFRHVDSQLADIGDVIANSFQMFGNEEQPRIARSSGRFRHHHLNQTVEHVVV